VTVVGHPGEQHYNPIGTVHGGYLSTMLDSVMGCAIHTELEPGVGYSTVSLQRVIYVGKRQAMAEGTIRDSAGRLYAHGMTTCLILR
jgi:acyl-coenzyme A thioesterase PaaI-like protein